MRFRGGGRGAPGGGGAEGPETRERRKVGAMRGPAAEGAAPTSAPMRRAQSEEGTAWGVWGGAARGGTGRREGVEGPGAGWAGEREEMASFHAGFQQAVNDPVANRRPAAPARRLPGVAGGVTAGNGGPLPCAGILDKTAGPAM